MDTNVIKVFEPQCYIDAICNTSERQVYTKCLNTLTRLNMEGEIKQEIRYNVYISYVRVSPTTQNIWTCSYEDCSVMEFVPLQEPVIRFKTENEPICLCVTGDNSILIGMSKQIKKYTTQGKILLTSKPSKSGQSVVRTPRRITECSVTHNVAVADKDNKDDGGDGKPNVLVMDKNLRGIFRFRGDILPRNQQTRKNTFNPRDVRYDSVGNLVISDCNRGYVHLLSGDGDYLKRIYTGDTRVWSIGIDEHNLLWVVTGYGRQVKLLQYYNFL